MRHVIARGVRHGLYASAWLLALPLAWRVGIWIASANWIPVAEVWMDVH